MEPVTNPVLLLAEDDPDLAFLFRRDFEKICPHWKLVWASNGVVAVDHMMESGMPRAVITDLCMPAMSGFELISWIRAKNHQPRVPIIVLSNVVEPELRQKCRELGADDFIPKTHPPEKLRQVLQRLYAVLESNVIRDSEAEFLDNILHHR